MSKHCFLGQFHDNKNWPICEFYCQTFCCHLGAPTLKVGDGMGGGGNGAPILAKTLENTAFFHKTMQKRGIPKTAMPTTTHPIPCLTPSYLWTLRSPGPKGPQGNLVGHSLGHPAFRGHPRAGARRARQTPVAGRRGRKVWEDDFLLCWTGRTCPR